MTKRNRIIWHLEVTPSLYEQLENYIAKDSFSTKSEFIRAAVRDRLKEEKGNLDTKRGGPQRPNNLER